MHDAPKERSHAADLSKVVIRHGKKAGETENTEWAKLMVLRIVIWDRIEDEIVEM